MSSDTFLYLIHASRTNNPRNRTTAIEIVAPVIICDIPFKANHTKKNANATAPMAVIPAREYITFLLT